MTITNSFLSPLPKQRKKSNSKSKASKQKRGNVEVAYCSPDFEIDNTSRPAKKGKKYKKKANVNNVLGKASSFGTDDNKFTSG